MQWPYTVFIHNVIFHTPTYRHREKESLPMSGRWACHPVGAETRCDGDEWSVFCEQQEQKAHWVDSGFNSCDMCCLPSLQMCPLTTCRTVYSLDCSCDIAGTACGFHKLDLVVIVQLKWVMFYLKVLLCCHSESHNKAGTKCALYQPFFCQVCQQIQYEQCLILIKD